MTLWPRTYFWDEADAVGDVDEDVAGGVEMAGDAAQEAQAKEVAQGHAAHGHAGANFETHPKDTF